LRKNFSLTPFRLTNLLFYKENPSLDISVIQTSAQNSTNFTAADAARDESLPVSESFMRDKIFELGLWLSGLESFVRVGNQSFGDGSQGKATTRDWAKEFYLTNSTLLLCSKLSLELCKILKDRENSRTDATEIDFLESLDGATAREPSFEEIFDLSVALKDAILINEALLRSAPLKFAEWIAWSNLLSEKFKQFEAVGKLINNAEREGANFLPQALKDLLENRQIELAAEADLRVILPLFAKVLRWLDIIGEMIERDEPLKPTLLLFARIHEQTQRMISYINNRLRRFASDEDPFFVMLDCTVYAASIEVRKVYNFELVGLSEIRQTPSIRAKIETAHGLLNDCFQQIIVDFAQLIDPQIDLTQLYPNFKTKLEQSLTLRRDLWSIQRAVQKAERGDKDYPLESVYKKLTAFQKGSMKSLFFKDLETVERFIEEVLRTQSKNDVVPILHRFGAYLETLFGQVNMRTVLANHPFDYPED
jgi:hypothetical protein